MFSKLVESTTPIFRKLSKLISVFHPPVTNCGGLNAYEIESTFVSYWSTTPIVRSHYPDCTQSQIPIDVLLVLFCCIRLVEDICRG